MKELILKRLKEIETEYDVTVLFASETGSRAWGFPSPDSDYDVRFIYMHPQDWYLAIDEKRDSIEYLNGDLDLVGWDIRKSLQLLRKSNAAMFERLQSPIIYLEQTEFREKLNQLAPAYFSPKAGLHHYLSMAFSYFKTCEASEMVKLKSYFYLLRTALASFWIIEKNSVPPLLFQDLLPLVEDRNTQEKIAMLLSMKSQQDETYLHPKEPELENYLKTILDYCECKAPEIKAHKGETEPINQLFRETLFEIK
ncbi:nucleotidyltransferase domain-containing protein [Adhaeribacter sp. BT258]|uniref:Nucleotidyltransferase domain-containing protein n=1 Tax=Adhaeribacter terrigena TaxID=2793070 RepID=A0ABS1BZP3_9BACT|nr:nucleotidyltransferase domain-containing protein [Adhaeribacter terrigena]MBK0402616.1 nucleotidyltransferase domain-containing protein [Adhaeribacter terrigena]